MARNRKFKPTASHPCLGFVRYLVFTGMSNRKQRRVDYAKQRRELEQLETQRQKAHIAQSKKGFLSRLLAWF